MRSSSGRAAQAFCAVRAAASFARTLSIGSTGRVA